MKKEIESRGQESRGQTFETLYFGGGTPSILDVQELESLVAKVHEHFRLRAGAEVTLEANPDDLDKEKLRHLKGLGFNRLSIGVQSFDDKELEYLGRVHSSQEAVNAIENAKLVGFTDLTIDLIYGIQVSNEETWQENLHWLNRLQLPHFSAYVLTVEPKTPLNYKIRKGLKKDVDDDLVVQQYELLKEFTRSHRFEHYEISNFARDGRYAVHNSNYWKQKPYIGIGPSAHSYDGKTRRWNKHVNREYIEAVGAGGQWFEEEKLSAKDRFNEYLMLSLRTIWGTNLEKLFEIYPAAGSESFMRQLEYYEMQDWVGVVDQVLKLTREGILFSDRIISKLFLD